MSFGFLIAFENTIRMSADSLIASAHSLIVVKLYYKECELLWVGMLSYVFFVGKRILSLLYNERIILAHFGDESKKEQNCIYNYKKAGKYLDDNRKCCILALQYKCHSL